MKFNLVVVICLVGIISACGIFKNSSSKKKYSINTSYMDLSVDPKEDFFQFANGTWVKENPIPDSESRWGSFNELDQENKVKLTTILETAEQNTDAKIGSTEQLIGDYYSAFMNDELRSEETKTFIKDINELNEKLTSLDDLFLFMIDAQKKGVSLFFNLGVRQDLKDVDKHMVYISQGGIGLPNKEYYDASKPDKKEILDAYQGHIQTILTLASVDNAEKHAEQALEFEMKLAEMMMSPAELRVPENTYNKLGVEEVSKFSSIIPLHKFIFYRGIEDVDTVIVSQPAYMEHAMNMLEKEDFETTKSYVIWRVLNHYENHLDESFLKAHFEFYGSILSGAKTPKPANERAIDEMTRMAVKDALGKAFVEEHFSPEAKDKINEMVDNLLVVYRERIQKLSWMTDETKVKAIEKLDAIGRKLGYPEEWKDYSDLTISRDSYLQNVDACRRFSIQENINKYGQPVDKNEWGMPAHMVNAYYHPLHNLIAFPAGIMQAPFFDINAEDAVNYGGIGMVIGHEFTHGFDDMGSKFAADGSFTNWWTEKDRLNFERRTQKLGDTYANFCTEDKHCVNPDLTMGENIADLGGITMAYHAYARTKEYKSGTEINGFTPSQRFFIAYAQLWKISYTEAELKKRLATDPHSPGMYRVNGPLMNSPEFFEAFDIQEGSPMRRNQKEISIIW